MQDFQELHRLCFIKKTEVRLRLPNNHKSLTDDFYQHIESGIDMIGTASANRLATSRERPYFYTHLHPNIQTRSTAYTHCLGPFLFIAFPF